MWITVYNPLEIDIIQERGWKIHKNMCIMLCTVKKVEIKGFIFYMCKNVGDKVERLQDIPQVIHKLSTKCG